MKLIVISYPESIPGEAVLINQLFKMGMEHFHLRKPKWSEQQVEQLINQILPEFRSRLVIHDHFNLAKKHHLGGIHFTGRTKHQINDWLSFCGTKSISCHSTDELSKLPEKIDYAFLSPLFPSISKKGYSGDFKIQELSNFLASIPKLQVIALGGIQEDKISICQQIGFTGVAVLGSIWGDDFSESSIMNRFTKIHLTCKNKDHM